MDYRIIPVTPLQQNCTLLRCPQTGATAIVDPGGEPQRINAALQEANATPVMVLLTHGHLDHVGAAPALARMLGVPIVGPHPDDAFWLDALPQQAQLFGFPPQEAFRPERWLDDGETVELGKRRLQVLHCPGHTPGHIVLFDADARLAQVGDVLFAGGIGRWDFPGGSHSDLLRSIHQRLFPLGDDVRFIPGHGPMSTFGEERRTNPMVRGGG
jgi:glyoxylase-like metal-dependent hydrolase (beta-lactamase superfamily II)